MAVSPPLTIGRLRVRGDGGDALALRLGVDRQLGAADLGPSRLPPAAILVVRSLRDPLPGRLDTRGTIPAPEWQRAVSAALDESAARAGRPAREAVPARAGAVVFADRAELLACAARDWCDGSLAHHWWWRALGMDAPAALLHGYEETPDAVPAALAALAARGLVVPFAGRIPPATATALAHVVAAAFGATPVAEAAVPASSRPDVVPADAADTVQARGRVARVPAPWRDMRSGTLALASLAPEQEALAGIALALHERPAATRTPAFARAAAAWRAGRTRGPMPAAQAAPSAPDAPTPPARLGSRSHSRPRRRTGGRRRSASARTAAVTIRKPWRGAAPEKLPTPADAAVPGRAPLAPADAESLALAVDTRLGGLFHLVLLGQLLDLYGDFTAPDRPGISLGVWDFTELLGRRLLRRPPAGDPVWRLLGQLAGRPTETAPGAGYRPRTWRVPADWLTPFPDGGTWRHAESDGRVVLVHPAGFAVVDSKRADLARELRRHGVGRARAGARVRQRTPALDHWVAHLADYVRARFALALGVPARSAARVALVRPARVLVTDTRVDVISALADLPIEVRLAGLDRDAGHVPAAGRALYFHFE